MKNSYPIPPQGKETWKQLSEVQRFGYSMSEVFSDFVETILAALLSLTDNMKQPDIVERLQQNRLTGEYEDRYMRLVKKYKENATRKEGSRPIDYFTHAWAWLQKETYAAQADVLGQLYESQISLGEHGQFLTPHPLSDAMVQMLHPTDGETVSDPACGSGRLFISMAKVNRNLHFYGVDVSPICARMTTLNMWLFDLTADIYQGNSLSMEMSYLWRIRTGGFIWETKIEAQSPAQTQEAHPKKIVTTETQQIPVDRGILIKKKKSKSKGETAPVQQTLFDFDEETS